MTAPSGTNGKGFWDIGEQLEKQASAGGGLIGRATISFCWKLFISGPQNESTFLFDNTPGSKDAAHEQAKAKAREHDAAKPPSASLALAIIMPAATIINKDGAKDRYFVTALYQRDYKELVKPSLVEKGVGGGVYWCRIGFVKSLDRKKKDPQRPGQYTDEMEDVAVLTEVYADEAAARAAAGLDVGSQGDPTVPDGWDPAMWRGLLPDLREMKAAGQTVDQIAAAYGVEAKYITASLEAQPA